MRCVRSVRELLSMLSKHLLLIGLRSAGKSTVGRALAERLQLDFFDSDQVIVANYFAQTGKQLNLRKAYQTIGEAKFRVLEKQAIKQLLAQHQTSVIATGGSSMLNANTVALLPGKAMVIYLQATITTLRQRWQKNPPGFININELAAELDQYYAQRARPYQSLADISVIIDNKTVDHIVNEIISTKKLNI